MPVLTSYRTDASARVGDSAGGALRLPLIEVCKGLAILLVVAGHLVKVNTLEVPDWYGLFKAKVYLFHMPLFMFMSGYVYFLARHPARARLAYGRYVVQRADRLLVPFLAMAILFTAGKLLFADALHVDAAPESWKDSLLSLVFHTEVSPIFTIWYLFVLFAISVVTPWLMVAFRGDLRWAFAASLVLHFCQLPDTLFLNRIAEFLVFFMAGGLAQSAGLLSRPLGPRVVLPGLLGFLLLLSLPLDRQNGLLVCGLLACLVIPELLGHLPLPLRSALHYLGQRSMSIYLFNVAAIGVVKGLYVRVLGYDGADAFLPLAATLLVAGVGLPLFVRWLSGRLPFTRTIHKYIA